ncbi:MAG: hypothetical protein Q8S96_09725 [Hydrogenophaga sp.]|uniref:hypothetical protein n=1 Tax=Hydrogenophaga sp. TaxID=1904254 RepID=UPI00271CA021|nr:hypothetical protein [Hydrogenophaga sp.]MDO9482960.1 hypothetical protein [Hydrogenophaga sp.]MDP3344720.1 hypothetical protein [Hydrogenophaga sp.]MDP3808110.1 hypothetical protein [Hydrogenophaga sp.]MDP3924263.1 hypothetical protein [Hydrogenophaga sp.]
MTGSDYSSIATPSSSSSASSITIEPYQLNIENVIDMNEAFYSILIVVATVWGIKQLINLFSQDMDK